MNNCSINTRCFYSKYIKRTFWTHTTCPLNELRAVLVYGLCHLSPFSHLEPVQLPVAQFSHAFSVVQPSLPVSQVPKYAAGPGCKISLSLICSHNCQLVFPGHNNFYSRLLMQFHY